jgi:cell division transport system ATP-binding protein
MLRLFRYSFRAQERMRSMINLMDVCFSYENGTEALKNVNLQIDNGDFAFVVGSSGAGKSSIIKLLLRETRATSGTVIVNGYNLNKLKERQIPKFRRSIGVVFQDFRLIPNMTVYDNVAFSLRVTDASNKVIRQQVPYVLELMELQDKARKYPYELSGGEQQRVALARALVNDPPLIIADEPTGNIDPEFSYEIVEMLQAINRCGTTIVMVTHEHEMVKYFGGRTINIENGEVVFDDYIGGAHESK